MDIKSLRMKYKALPDRSSQVRDLAHMVQYANELCTGALSYEDDNGVREGSYELERVNNDLRQLARAANRPAGRDHKAQLENLLGVARQASHQIALVLREVNEINHPEGSELESVHDNIVHSVIPNIASALDYFNHQNWNNSTVVRMAQEILRSGDYEAAPILADALEDAGSTDSRVLNILRTPNHNSLVYTIRQIAGQGL